MLFGNAMAGGQGDQTTDIIPPKLQVLMAGWEDNFNRIRTFQADARLLMEDARFLACKDLDGKSYPDQNVRVSIWKDNARFRTDFVYDRTFDTRNNEVNYNLPYGEHIMTTTEWEEQKEDVKRKYGVLQTTRRFMQLEDKVYNYRVEGKDFTINKPGTRFIGPKACEWMWKGSIIGSRTFPDYITEKAKLSSMRSFAVEDLSSGRYAVNHAWVGTSSGREVSGKTHLVIDATKGYTVESVRREAGGQRIYEGKFKYAEAGNVWVLVGADYKDYDWRGEVNKVRSAVSLSIDVNSLKVNEPVDPNIFTVKSLGIQKGSLVRDSVAGKRYVYNDVPIRLKAALVEAQTLIDESAEFLEDIPVDTDTLVAEAPDSPPVPSQAEPALQDEKIDASSAIQSTAQSTTETSGIRTLMVGIVIGAAIVAIAALFYRRQKHGRTSK